MRRPQGATLHREARSAFSLAELVVAIGVLVLMFALAGQVFSLTIRSTGQATALTTVTQTLSAFEDTLREDLRHVERGQSFIWIQGNPVNAYWTQAGKEADDDAGKPDAGPATGYPHASDPNREYGPEDTKKAGNLVPPRADMLMFVTARPGVSYTDPGIAANTQLVVYGHALPAEFEADVAGGTVAYKAEPNTVMPPLPLTPFPTAAAGAGIEYASPTKVSPVPAEEWQLTRRSVLLVPTDPPKKDWTPRAYGLTNVEDEQMFLFGLTDVVWKFDFEQQVVTPLALLPFYPPNILSPSVATPDAARRGALDVRPPAPLAWTFGQYMLPQCASFKVEWALHPRSDFVNGRLEGVKQMIWIDPGEPEDSSKLCSGPLRRVCEAREAAPAGSLVRKNLGTLLNDPIGGEDGIPFTLGARFGGKLYGPESKDWVAPDDRPNIALFGAARRGACRDTNGDGKVNCTSGDMQDVVPDPVFPAALRITVDVFDSERRLDRPIRHVMVIPVGG